MSTGYDTGYVRIGRAYAALRWGGASRDRARLELGLTPARAQQLESLFGVRHPGKAASRMRPAFARHGEHVAAVLAGGGYPAIRP